MGQVGLGSEQVEEIQSVWGDSKETRKDMDEEVVMGSVGQEYREGCSKELAPPQSLLVPEQARTPSLVAPPP